MDPGYKDPLKFVATPYHPSLGKNLALRMRIIPVSMAIRALMVGVGYRDPPIHSVSISGLHNIL